MTGRQRAAGGSKVHLLARASPRVRGPRRLRHGTFHTRNPEPGSGKWRCIIAVSTRRLRHGTSPTPPLNESTVPGTRNPKPETLFVKRLSQRKFTKPETRHPEPGSGMLTPHTPAQVLLLTADQATDRGGMSASSSSCALALAVLLAPRTPKPENPKPETRNPRARKRGKGRFINSPTRPLHANEGNQTTRRALAHNHPKGWKL